MKLIFFPKEPLKEFFTSAILVEQNWVSAFWEQTIHEKSSMWKNNGVFDDIFIKNKKTT